MGLRYKKRIKLGKHVTLNISKSGISPSVKIGKVTRNLKNKITTIDLPGGLFYVKNKKKKK